MLVEFLLPHVSQLHKVHKLTKVIPLLASVRTTWINSTTPKLTKSDRISCCEKNSPHIISLQKRKHRPSYRIFGAWKLQEPYNDLEIWKKPHETNNCLIIIIINCFTFCGTSWFFVSHTYLQLPVSPVILYTSWEFSTLMSLLNPKSPTFKCSALEFTKRTFLQNQLNQPFWSNSDTNPKLSIKNTLASNLGEQ